MTDGDNRLDYNVISFLMMTNLLSIVVTEQNAVKTKLSAIRQAKSSISIADMFDMQMRMNKLSQLSEMVTSVVSASNSAINTMARGIKQ
jgi:hypothetical protein